MRPDQNNNKSTILLPSVCFALVMEIILTAAAATMTSDRV